ncbi:MAG: hypothetical protein KGJ13_07935 [Patescibacteria group bacterium]|nr:hypothetical protein [Patescibacteria group bacterium]
MSHYHHRSRCIGGNSGYVGYSKSVRAVEAEREGRFPKTTFRQVYGLDPSKFVTATEWHHSSKFGNRVHYYDPADVYAVVIALPHPTPAVRCFITRWRERVESEARAAARKHLEDRLNPYAGLHTVAIGPEWHRLYERERAEEALFPGVAGHVMGRLRRALRHNPTVSLDRLRRWAERYERRERLAAALAEYERELRYELLPAGYRSERGGRRVEPVAC